MAALAPAADGSFYLVDRQVPVIRRYDREGTHLAVKRPVRRLTSRDAYEEDWTPCCGF